LILLSISYSNRGKAKRGRFYFYYLLYFSYIIYYYEKEKELNSAFVITHTKIEPSPFPSRYKICDVYHAIRYTQYDIRILHRREW